MANSILKFQERERKFHSQFSGMGNSITDFCEQEWEASIAENCREREFPLTPDVEMSAKRYDSISDVPES